MQSDRHPGLDLLRALAILLVVWCHGIYIVYDTLHPFIGNIFNSVYGHFGVSLFFVLSGFLVGRIFLKDIALKENYKKGAIINFWIRRWFRTIPNYYLFLIIYLLLSILVKGFFQIVNPNFIIEDPTLLIRYLFFTQNFITDIPSFFGQTWSLSVEEWFYLFLPFPFVYLLLVRRNIRRFIPFILISILMFFQLWKIFVFLYEPSFFQHFKVVFNLDYILMGVMLAYVYLQNNSWLKEKKNQLLLLGLLLIMLVHFIYIKFIVVAQPQIIYQPIAGFCTSLGFAFCMPYFIWLPLKGRMRKVIEVISLSSYTVYLSHFIVLQFFVDKLVLPFFPDTHSLWRYLAFLIFIVFNVGVAYAHYLAFEVPMMNLRDTKWVKRLTGILTLSKTEQ